MDFDKVGFLAKFLYKHILRDIIYGAVTDPDTEWDDVLVDVLDRVFDWSE